MSENATNDPLSALLGDSAAEVNREKLALFLKPYVSFGKDQSLAFLPAFNPLSATEKIEIVFAAGKARSLLFDGVPEGFLQSEIGALGIMPEGTSRPTIKKLSDSRKIRKDSEGRYYMPLYMLQEVIERKQEVKKNNF